MDDDIEEYRSLLDSSLSGCSDNMASFETWTSSSTAVGDEEESSSLLPLPPPLEEPLSGAVHEVSAHCRTVLESMQQAVPIAVRPSTIGTKKSGLFFAGEMSVAPGQMLFVTHPTAMAHAIEDYKGPGAAASGSGNNNDTDSSNRMTAVCDYCFKGPEALVESDGGGYEKGRAAQRCTGCFVLSFCGTSCHRKAWKQFHKYECAHLRELKRCDPVGLMLLRLLLLDEASCIPKNVMDVMQALTDPPILSLHSEIQKNIQSCAVHTHRSVSSTKRTRLFVRDLLRRIIGNQANLTRADGSARVMCFDVALANLNHSCDPNAFVFVEGRQARVRTARDIFPGEEITVDLADVRLDMISRNDSLKLFSADLGRSCRCKLCTSEMQNIVRCAPKDEEGAALMLMREAKVVQTAKTMMAAIAEEVWEDKRRALIEEFAKMADDETNSSLGMVTGSNKPRPWIRMAAATMYLGIRDLESALYYALTSFFFSGHCVSPETVADLRVMVNVLVAVCQLPETDKQYRRMFGGRRKDGYAGFPKPAAFRVFAAGCVSIYQHTAVMVFGPKLSFVRAVLYWGRELQMLCDSVVPGTSDYDQTFEDTQQQLVNWCRGGKTDCYAPLRSPSVGQLNDLQDLMDLLDVKHGKGVLHEKRQATGHGMDDQRPEDAGHAVEEEMVDMTGGKPGGMKWMDSNQQRQDAYEKDVMLAEAEKRRSHATDRLAPMAAS